MVRRRNKRRLPKRRNAYAAALRQVRPKAKPSVKRYRRRAKHKKGEEE